MTTEERAYLSGLSGGQQVGLEIVGRRMVTAPKGLTKPCFIGSAC